MRLLVETPPSIIKPDTSKDSTYNPGDWSNNSSDCGRLWERIWVRCISFDSRRRGVEGTYLELLQLVPVRHQNSVFPISTNTSRRIWKSVFLIRLSQLNVRFPDFKIRVNIGLYEYINTVWWITKCYSKFGVIAFWNAIISCRLPKQVPAHFTPPTESLVIYGDICGSSKLDSIVDFVWVEKEGMAGMCFAPAKEEFFKSRSQSDRSRRCYRID
jgi:hypothetical protein